MFSAHHDTPLLVCLAAEETHECVAVLYRSCRGPSKVWARTFSDFDFEQVRPGIRGKHRGYLSLEIIQGFDAGSLSIAACTGYRRYVDSETDCVLASDRIVGAVVEYEMEQVARGEAADDGCAAGMHYECSVAVEAGYMAPGLCQSYGERYL